MYLKSLTLKGFKSFASATALNFEPGITAIVGPNGSGKSNIVDALSWVMGEQGAKHLRGAKMEDVIFAGTTGRPPLGRAEVTLTIDNTDGVLPIDYTEVTISRTLFRAGGSEYAINGHRCRLLDVQELLSDTGMGCEMHVIVGQGQLDAILAASPEQRRGFIEEAAGVLKHRNRKEKAHRKLESTQANLARLGDLVTEIRRQLKPLGRQAEVARKAATVQAELRDAKARLLADELSQAISLLESDLADEARQRQAQEQARRRLAEAQTAEASAERHAQGVEPLVVESQGLWYELAALRERLSTTLSVSAERMRHAGDQPVVQTGSRDPAELEAQAAQVRAEENQLRDQVRVAEDELGAATLHRNTVEKAYAQADKQHTDRMRAVADRREGLARLHGQVNSMKSRLQAGAEEQSRLAHLMHQALDRAAAAEHEFTALETRITGVDNGAIGLDADFETLEVELEAINAVTADLAAEQARLHQRKASYTARRDVLEQSLQHKDAPGALLAASSELDGLLGAVATLISVQPGWETAVSTALGNVTEAVAVTDIGSALDAVQLLKDQDLGRAGLLLGGAPEAPGEWPALPGGQYLVELIAVDAAVRPAFVRLLHKVVAVDDVEVARALVERLPDVTAVTRDGDLLSSWYVLGGSNAKQSLIELQAAADEARAGLAETEHELDRLRFALQEQANLAAEVEGRRDMALEALNESDAQAAALAEQLGTLGQTAHSARSEAARFQQSIEAARANQDADSATLAELESRLALARQDPQTSEPDPAERDRLGEQARQARQHELEARLALRTAQERLRSLSGRADSLLRAAAHERAARAQAQARADQLRREAKTAEAVHTAAQWLAAQVGQAQTDATAARAQTEAAREQAQAQLTSARRLTRERSRALDELVAGAHRNEMARIEQRMRVEQLSNKGIDELGMDPQALVAEYGPQLPVPVLVTAGGKSPGPEDPLPDPVPYVREEQLKRLREAERNLQVLGRVNPLALEEFDALNERHQFLAEQLEDLKKTRRDLLDIIDDIDDRVQEVFTAAYTDIERAFADVFARLFPGGEGKLILTDPDDMLATGVDVEARPAGKKVKRLSLLSGGERSLVAVAFLLSLFIARPSPFYILDEVEAALDDVNLGRLLQIYEQLRERSQLLVITHQKRTMEIADVLYGVTMRNDGVSTVISQRLHSD